MKTNKKISFIILVITFTLLSSPVLAKEVSEEIYYTNQNNVSLTKKEYDKLSQFYFEGYQKFMTANDYKKFKESDIMNAEIETVELKEITPFSTEVYGTKKNLKISKLCTTNCTISVVATWTSNPNVRSYDVIGAILDSTNLLNSPVTKTYNSTTSSVSSEIKNFTNGFGTSIKLLNGDDIVVTQEYRVSKGGTIYASYQHAISSISLANSKNYTLSRAGLGGVFKFNSTISNKYDAMKGVSITV